MQWIDAAAARSVVTRLAPKLENVLQQKPGSGVQIRRLDCETAFTPKLPLLWGGEMEHE
jgi:hypothetical protein